MNCYTVSREAGINRVIKPFSFEVDLRLDSHEGARCTRNVLRLVSRPFCANLFCAHIVAAQNRCLLDIRSILKLNPPLSHSISPLNIACLTLFSATHFWSEGTQRLPAVVLMIKMRFQLLLMASIFFLPASCLNLVRRL